MSSMLWKELFSLNLKFLCRVFPSSVHFLLCISQALEKGVISSVNSFNPMPVTALSTRGRGFRFEYVSFMTENYISHVLKKP